MSKTVTIPSPNNALVVDKEITEKENAQHRVDIANRLVRKSPNSLEKEYKPSSKELNRMYLSKVAVSVAAEIRDNRTIMELLPDTKAIFTMMISTIKSPNTMIGMGLRWDKVQMPDGVSWDGDPIEILQNYFEETYSLDSKLTEILWNVLCWKGSHPVMTLPETTLDDLINGQDVLAGEAFDDVASVMPYTLKGEFERIDNIGISFEANKPSTPNSLGEEVKEYKTIQDLFKMMHRKHTLMTDNYEILKRPTIQTRIKKEEVVLAGEAFEERMRGHMFKKDIFKKNKAIEAGKDGYLAKEDVFRRRKYKHNDLLRLANTLPEDRGLGNGLELDLPAESVIPIKDMCYLVLCDGYGNALSLSEHVSEYESMKRGIDLQSQDNLGGNLINRARNDYQGAFDSSGHKGQKFTLQALIEEYGTIFDISVKEALTDSKLVGDGEVILPDMDTVHLMALIRALRGQKTTVLVVPPQLMTYWHLEKNEYGVGTSMISKYKYLASQRISVRLAELLAKVTNSVPRKEVIIHIDEDEKEPEQVAEMMRTACIDNLQSEYSVGDIDTRDIITNFVSANTTIRPVHKDLPDHWLEVKDFTRSVVEPDKELTENLRNDWYKALDTQPELIDEFYKPQFAVEFITKNVMYTKSIIDKQRTLEPHLNSHIKQHIYNLPQVYRLLKNGLKIKPGKYNEDDVIEYIVESLNVKFPRPEQSEADSTMQGFKEISEYIGMAVEAYINEDMIYRLGNGELVNEDTVKALAASMKAICQREWLEHGTVDTLRKLTAYGDDEESKAIDIAGMLESHSENMANNLGDYVKDIVERLAKKDAAAKKAKSAIEERLAKLEEAEAARKAEEEAATNPPAEEGTDTPPEGDNTPPEETPASDEPPADDEFGVPDEEVPEGDEPPAEGDEPAPAGDEPPAEGEGPAPTSDDTDDETGGTGPEPWDIQ